MILTIPTQPEYTAVDHYKQDRNILKKLILKDCHPLKDIIPVKKTYVHNLREKGCARPKINTERFMNTFVNRLIFKLHLL